MAEIDLRDREGLDAMMQAAREGRFQVLYFHSLSRLARESVISMPMLKDLVYNHRVRVVSVSEGVDSAIDGWDMLATMFSLQHEQYLKELRKNVRRGQEGAVGRGFSVGDYCFGYMGEPIPGSEVVSERIAQRRREHDELDRRFRMMNRKRDEIAKPPTEDFLREQLLKLDELLQRADTPAAALALRSLIGGEIFLEEVRNPDGRGGYFRGRFVTSTFALEQTLRNLDAETSSPSTSDVPATLPFARVEEEVVIDFRQPSQCESLSDQVRDLGFLSRPWLQWIRTRLHTRANDWKPSGSLDGDPKTGEPAGNDAARAARLSSVSGPA